MHPRLAVARVRDLASRFPCVLILGARQVGKTTLARSAFATLPYVDLEQPRMRELFSADARFQLADRSAAGLVVDEAQTVPDVFPALRGLIDADRNARGRFVLLGSVQPGLVRGVSESLAGRVGIVDLDPLCATEAAAGPDPMPWQETWLRGGYPDALHGDFREWHEAYLRTYVERDLPQLGVQADPVFSRRLLTLLGHHQGGVLNVSQLCNALDTSHARVTRLLDVLEQTFLIRRLPPLHRNIGKRLVKSTKTYIRDTGLLHHLLGVGSHEQLRDHPIRGASWETFVVEDLLRRERMVRPFSRPHFWRTAAGAEVDLILERGADVAAVECKAGAGTARQARRVRDVLADVGATKGWILDQTAGEERLNEQVRRRGFGDDLDWLP